MPGFTGNDCGRQFRRQIIPQWADQHEFGAARTGLTQPVADDVAADAAAGNHRVLRCHAAEGNHQLGFRGDVVPGDGAARNVLIRPHRMGQDHGGGAGAIAVDGPDITAERVQEAVDLALCVMKPSGAGPAIRPAIHRFGAVRLVHAAQLCGEQVQRLRPFQLDEAVAATLRIRAGATFQPPLAHCRPGDAGFVPRGGGDVAQDRRRIGIAGVRFDHQRVAVAPRAEGAPMGEMRVLDGWFQPGSFHQRRAAGAPPDAERPPSTTICVPVMLPASSEQRYSTVSATSCGRL